MTLPYDELNELRTRLEEEAAETSPSGEKRYDPKKACDIILDYLIYCYVMGVDNANEMLSTSIAINTDEMEESIYHRIEGKNFEDRVSEYAEEGNIENIMRVAETDAHRVLNDSTLTTGIKGGGKTKTWWTMQDERVREYHVPLDGVTVGINDDFVTYDGYKAQRPGAFGVPELDINCRCYLWINP